jgi:protease I
MAKLGGKRILIIATNGFEQAELEVPRDMLRKEGAEVNVASLDGAEIRGWKGKDWCRTAPVDLKIADAKMDDYDALVIPGGVMNPDKLRVDEDAMALVKAFLKSGKVVAAVCHGPWLLVQADALRGREATSYKSIRKDLENAGANWVDREVVVDDGIITSRNPDDLPAFSAKIVEEVREGRHHERNKGRMPQLSEQLRGRTAH